MFCAVPLASRAAVLLIYNTESLLDETATELQGTSSGGDYLQFLLTGPNNLPDAPDEYGNAGGDDELVSIFVGNNPSHVGANEPAPNWNLGLFNETLEIDNALIGENVFLRFWNASSPFFSTHYGDSAVTSIPTPPGIGAAFLDLVPTSGSPRTTDTAFAALAPANVPEPSGFAFLSLVAMVLIKRGVFRRAGGKERGPVPV